MSDGRIEIDTAINTSGAEKGIKSLSARLKGIGTSSITKGIGNVGMAITGIAGAAGAAVGAIKAASEKISELTELYNVQTRAEVQLAQAAKNNPYLLSESVDALRNYAGELQGISTYGDEELLPFMAQLAASGRTQQEIMDIMSASVNVAASGMMSLDGAVSALNGTFNGNIGALGRQIGELKGLTAEQLKNGEAVKLIAQRYDGMAAEVAKATGTSQQLKNAVGDLKEELGASFEKALSPMRKFFTELVSGWSSALRARRDYEEGLEDAKKGATTTKAETSLVAAFEAEIRKSEERTAALKRSYEEARRAEEAAYERVTESGKKALSELSKQDRDYYYQFVNSTNSISEQISRQEELIDGYKEKIAEAQQQIERNQSAEKAQKDAQLAAQRAAESKAALQAEIDARDKLRDAYDETIRQKQEEINQRRINGEEISAEAEAQEMYNTAFSAYVQMMSNPAFKGNKGTYKHEVDARKDIADWGQIALGAEAMERLKEFEGELREAVDEANGLVKNQYEATLEILDAEYKAVIENEYLKQEEKTRIAEEYAQKRREIETDRDNAELASIDEHLAAISGKNETYWTKYQERAKEVAGVKAEIESERARREKAISEDERMTAAEKSEAIAQMNAEMNERMKRADEEMAQAKRNLWAGIASDVANYTSRAVDIISQAADIMLETVKNQARAEQAELEAKYRKGEISEEEYNEAVTESKKKAAKEEYKIQMAQWGASLLQATANIAQGVTKAIAQGGFPGLVTGALVAAAGGVQIASIIASKPTPPSFSTGGIVGGSSYHGDNVAANLNSREMVMNMSQQKGLWDFINGGSNGQGGGANIVINNSASNIATAQPKLSRDKIEIMIDARVNESMKKGRFDQSMSMAQEGMGGDYYGI